MMETKQHFLRIALVWFLVMPVLIGGCKTAGNAYFATANKKYDAGDYGGAIGDYTEAIRLSPSCAEAYNNRGNAKDAKGDHDGAIADFTEAIRIDLKHGTLPRI
jgi:tetratricopeptide (TPR) repeat protein